MNFKGMPIEKAVRREDDLDRVRNLEREIVLVDEEIDKPVYVLYGLTDEEINAMEGKWAMIELDAVITCPQCGFAKAEQMPLDT